MTRNDFKENISQAIDEMKKEQWCEYFYEDESLRCALDRIFDDAVVYMIQGESYRGKNLETYSLTTSANRNK